MRIGIVVDSACDLPRDFLAANGVLVMPITRRIRDGLDAPHVCISYGRAPGAVANLPGYAGLARAAVAQGVQILVSPMSKTAAVNVGAGALSLAFAASGHRPH